MSLSRRRTRTYTAANLFNTIAIQDANYKIIARYRTCARTPRASERTNGEKRLTMRNKVLLDSE